MCGWPAKRPKREWFEAIFLQKRNATTFWTQTGKWTPWNICCSKFDPKLWRKWKQTTQEHVEPKICWPHPSSKLIHTTTTQLPFPNEKKMRGIAFQNCIFLFCIRPILLVWTFPQESDPVCAFFFCFLCYCFVEMCTPLHNSHVSWNRSWNFGWRGNTRAGCVIFPS